MAEVALFVQLAINRPFKKGTSTLPKSLLSPTIGNMETDNSFVLSRETAT